MFRCIKSRCCFSTNDRYPVLVFTGFPNILVIHLLVLRPSFLSDISLIYHVIRGQGTIKLYVVYNVLEVRSINKLTDFLFGENFQKAFHWLWKLQFFGHYRAPTVKILEEA
jgi:Eukaryotic membrane protein family